jgi:hypothetical protein
MNLPVRSVSAASSRELYLANPFDRFEEKRHFAGMGTQEIIAEPPKLNRRVE